MKRAVIFDMDGVLVDSEYAYLEARKKVMKTAGYEISDEYNYGFTGVTYEKMWKKLKKDFQLPDDITTYIGQMKKIWTEIVDYNGVKAMPSAIELVEKLSLLNIPMAVASSAPLKEIKSNLKSLGIINHFSVLLSAEDVRASKPAPDVFITAAQRLQLNCNKCIVIEDSTHGVAAANAAGIFCIGYVKPNYPPLDISNADMVIDDLSNLNIETLVKV